MLEKRHSITVEELDYLHSPDGNTIGMLLSHIAGVEYFYQVDTFEKRDLNEEEVIKPLFIKEGSSFGITVEVHFFEIEVIGGKAKIHDPDQLIHDIAWKSAEEVKKLELSFPEDLKIILDFMRDLS